MEAFVDRFIMGDETANTNVTTHPFELVDHERWYDWWGSGDANLPDMVFDPTGTETVAFETECSTLGSDWETASDETASNGAYVTVKAGMNSTNAPPTGAGSTITIPFTVSKDSTYFVFALANGPTAQDDSAWWKIDDEDFATANGMGTVGWQWVKMGRRDLTAGEHTITLTYREDGLLVDKIAVSSFAYGPEELPAEDVAAAKCDV